MVMTNNPAERVQEVRDLRQEITGIEAADQQEVIFRETSPPRRKATLYSMVTGEPIKVPTYLLERTLAKRLPNGKYMFTARQAEAPRYKRGEVKCFLHPDSAEQSILAEIGLQGIVCDTANLASIHSKRIHGLHRHKNEWAALQEHLTDQKENEDREQQRQQLEATLSIARAAGALDSDEQPTRRKNRPVQGKE